MLDNALISAVADQIDAALALAGWDFIVSQKTQPTQQGVSTTPMVLIQKMFDQHYGGQISSLEYQAPSNDFNASETQIVITTVQISSLVLQNPEDLSIPTASDVSNHVKIFLQSRTTIETLRLQGLNVIQVAKIMNSDFVDDRDRFEMNPSFDIQIQHERTVITKVNSAASAVGGIFAVPDSAGESFP